MSKTAKKTALKAVKSEPKTARKSIRSANTLDEMLGAIAGKTLVQIAETAQKPGMSAERLRLIFAALYARKVVNASRIAA